MEIHHSQPLFILSLAQKDQLLSRFAVQNNAILGLRCVPLSSVLKRYSSWRTIRRVLETTMHEKVVPVSGMDQYPVADSRLHSHW
jgi:hypothetical protein